MGLDYRYLLFVERPACLDLLERLGEMALPGSDPPTTLVLPDRSVTLPYAGWMATGSTIRWDDTSATWDFMTVLCFEPDAAIEGYLERVNRPPDDDPEGRAGWYDAQGRARLGYVYLSVHRDMTDWPSATDDDLVLFAFGTPGSSMSVLFWESASIRRTFIHLLESCRGVYGLLDREDEADLFWLRGREVSTVLPAAEIPLVEIERMVDTAVPLPFSFAADELVAAARQLRRASGGAELGALHWLAAVLEAEVVLPGALSAVDRSAAAQRLRGRLRGGEIGDPLPEERMRELAEAHARRAGASLVTAEAFAGVIAELAGGAI